MPTDSRSHALNRAGQVFLWGGLIAVGARRGGLLGLLAIGYGLERLSSVALGTPLSKLLMAMAKPDKQKRFGNGSRDLVDEQSWESFPASDPPGQGVG